MKKTLNDYYLEFRKNYADIGIRSDLMVRKYNTLIELCRNYNEYLFDLLKTEKLQYFLYESEKTNTNIDIASGINEEVISLDPFIIGFPYSINNIEYKINRLDPIVKKYADQISQSSLFFELLHPEGTLNTCIIIRLLENYYNKRLYDLTETELSECSSVEYNDLTRRFIPTVINSEYVNIFLNSSFYFYRINPKSSSPWIIYKVQIHKFKENSILLKDIQSDRIFSIPCSKYYKKPNANLMIAFNKEMLDNQISSVKNGISKFKRDSLNLLENKLTRIENQIEKDKNLLKKYNSEFIFEEEKINNALNYGKIN